MLHGLVALHPGLALLSEHHVLFRSDIASVRDQVVSIVSGGGSGHEPAHAGYVGAGMLSAAVAGEVFTSPTPDAVFAAIRQVTGPAGVLLIVKNYTGDRLNFGLAAQMARSENLSVEMVTVADDVALGGSHSDAGARGLAGTILVHKIAGAAAAQGRSLSQVAEMARSAAADLATIGLSLSAGTNPSVAKPSYILAEDELELGLGIHGEPGVRRMPMQPANDLAETLVQSIVSEAHLRAGERVALLVNNLGATTAMELAIFGGHAVRALLSRGLQIERVYSGAFVTSLDAAGVSLSILRVDDDRLALLDAPTTAPAWPNVVPKPVTSIEERVIEAPSMLERAKSDFGTVHSVLRDCITAACDALIGAEAHLTELDRASGDGDLGLNLARGALAVKARLSEYPLADSAATLRAVGSDLRKVVGGSSGPFYGAMLVGAAASLQNSDKESSERWARAASGGCRAIAELGGATAGDRTMLDALLPFVTEFRLGLQRGTKLAEAFDFAVRAAETGAERTSTLLPRRGRAVYLGDRAIGYPDPGAVAVAIWLRAVQQSLKV